MKISKYTKKLNNTNILYSSQREIKAVVRLHNEEHISMILSPETHHMHTLRHTPLSLNLHKLIEVYKA